MLHAFFYLLFLVYNALLITSSSMIHTNSVLCMIDTVASFEKMLRRLGLNNKFDLVWFIELVNVACYYCPLDYPPARRMEPHLPCK